jgi:2-dehydro-3-deoxyphosphogluconate aldolase/(4S)-4-hydroxy-2-oxoglutarate aldolase
MKSKTVFAALKQAGVVPVIRAESEKRVMAAVDALIGGGIAVAEITLTVPNAIKTIERCAGHFGDKVIVGAGTVTRAGDAQRAIAAGSRFVVTPTVNIAVINVCRQAKVCVIGGALTPTEILTVWEAGADAVKVFPAKAVGGPAYIKMIHEPLPHIPLVPTGGVNLDTIEAYLSAGAEFVGAGGDLAGRVLIEAGDTEEITRRARRYVAAIGRARP